MKINLLILTILLAVCSVVALGLGGADGAPARVLQFQLQPIDFGGHAVELTEEIRDRTAEVFRSRLRLAEIEGEVTSVRLDTLHVQIKDRANEGIAREVLTKAGQLEFRTSDYNAKTQELEWTKRLDGSCVMRATAAPEEAAGWDVWTIRFDLTTDGALEFAKLTKEYLGRPLGIYFDDVKLSAPTIQAPIEGGMVTITGNFKEAEAKRIANYLNAGALPVKVGLVE